LRTEIEYFPDPSPIRAAQEALKLILPDEQIYAGKQEIDKQIKKQNNPYKLQPGGFLQVGIHAGSFPK
jgi:hypothetical protein